MGHVVQCFWQDGPGWKSPFKSRGVRKTQWKNLSKKKEVMKSRLQLLICLMCGISDSWDLCNVVGCKSCNFSTENSGWKLHPAMVTVLLKGKWSACQADFRIEHWLFCWMVFADVFPASIFLRFSTILQSYLGRIGLCGFKHRSSQGMTGL